MSAIWRLESRRQVRGSVLLSGLFALVTLFMLAAFPGFADQAELLEEAMPPALVALMGFEAMHTIEGFSGGYVYSMVLIAFGGVYVAYVSAGLIAGDVRARRLDLTLSNPVSRESVLVQKLAALWVPIVVLNVVLTAVLVGGAAVIGESFDPVALAMAHLLSVPYLLVCAGIGLLFSVVLGRAETAQVAALGLVFLLWLVEGLSETAPGFEWLERLTPSHYYDPTAVLVHEEYSFVDAGILLAVFLALLAIATAVFVRRDI